MNEAQTSPSSSSWSTGSSVVVSVVPVGDYERVLRKESAKRRNNSLSFTKAVVVVVACIVFLFWIAVSSWSTIQEPTFYKLTNHSSGQTTSMLVTPNNDPHDTKQRYSFSVRFSGNSQQQEQGFLFMRPKRAKAASPAAVAVQTVAEPTTTKHGRHSPKRSTTFSTHQSGPRKTRHY